MPGALASDAPRLTVCAGVHAAGACVRQRTELRRARAYPDQAPDGVRRRLASGPMPAASAPAKRIHLLTISEEKPVTLGTILLIILVLMLIGAIPTWSHSRSWGYGPSGGLGLVLVVVVALLLMGRL